MNSLLNTQPNKPKVPLGVRIESDIAQELEAYLKKFNLKKPELVAYAIEQILQGNSLEALQKSLEHMRLENQDLTDTNKLLVLKNGKHITKNIVVKVKLSRNQHKSLKALSALQGVTMDSYLNELVDKSVKSIDTKPTTKKKSTLQLTNNN